MNLGPFCSAECKEPALHAGELRLHPKPHDFCDSFYAFKHTAHKGTGCFDSVVVFHFPLRRSYETADLWPLLAAPADGVTVSFVKAERSTFRWGGSDEARIRALGHVVHELPNAGHWVHTDNPAGLFHILAPSFNSEPDLHAQLSPRNNVVASHSAAATVSSAGSRQLTALEL